MTNIYILIAAAYVVAGIINYILHICEVKNGSKWDREGFTYGRAVVTFFLHGVFGAIALFFRIMNYLWTKTKGFWGRKIFKD